MEKANNGLLSHGQESYVTVDLADAPLDNYVPLLLDALTHGNFEDFIEFETGDDPRALLRILERMSRDRLRASSCRVGADSWLVRLRREEARVQPAPPAFLRNSIFQSLDSEARELLAHSARECGGRRNEVVVGADDRFDYVGIVREGMLAIVTESSSRTRLFAELFPGDAFGEIAFLDRGRMIGNIVVWSKTARYTLLPCATLKDLTTRFPEFARDFSVLCAQRTRTLADIVGSQTTDSVMCRVACALLPYAVPAAKLVPALPPLESLTLSHIAIAAGTVKEVVSRTVAELESQGAVARRRGHIVELNRAKLLAARKAVVPRNIAIAESAPEPHKIDVPKRLTYDEMSRAERAYRAPASAYVSINALLDAIERKNDPTIDNLRRLGIRKEDLPPERPWHD
ncbi:MAG TPA: Crp/Fnr family transcriptional regulator [Candidatus Baltobacteraceae bacterium]